MQNKPSKPSNRKQRFDGFIKYSNITFQLIAAIFLGVWGGMRLDAWLGSKPWFTVILSLLGLSAGMYLSLKDFIGRKKD
ncbi:MAG: AtpZ/AtpI family protein [Fimbriimonadaceae bacterium]|nr:AtpZ/AtpI family protein [Chitinophagales bacterium]